MVKASAIVLKAGEEAVTLGDIVRTFKEGSPFAPSSAAVHQLYKAREEQRLSHKNLKQMNPAESSSLRHYGSTKSKSVVYFGYKSLL
eukprot:SAG22_NODE_143_length_17909_cov_34.254969_3_plen_87_part_00